MGKKIVIDAPKHPVLRYALRDERHVKLDLRGIRNPNKLLNGMLNPSKGAMKRYVSPDHLQSMVDEYFESCNGPLIDRNGQLVYDRQGNLVKTQVRPYTVSGLALYLGIKTESLKKFTSGGIDNILDEMRVAVDPDHKTYASVILEARQKIEAYAEGRLYDRDGSNGARYVLDSAFKWVTQKEQAEIDRIKAETEFKKQMIDSGVDDTGFTINIVRASKTGE